ncbi:hypothetical protein D3C71_1891020 [compost metagenome]
MIAGGDEFSVKPLDSLGKDRAGNGWDDRSDQPGAPGSKAASQQIRHITRFCDHPLNHLQRAGLDQSGSIDRPGNRDRRNARELCNVGERDRPAWCDITAFLVVGHFSFPSK